MPFKSTFWQLAELYLVLIHLQLQNHRFNKSLFLSAQLLRF